MKKCILTMVLALLFSGFILNANVNAKSKKGNFIEGVCPTDKTLLKKQTKIQFYTGYFGSVKRKTAFYSFSATKTGISGTFGLGLGPISLSVSTGAPSGSWGVKANQQKWSRVKLNEQGDIHRYTDRFCNMTKKMTNITKEWATVLYTS